MTNIQKYTSLKLPWSQVAAYIGNLVSALLGRAIQCQAKAEDAGYWGISTVDDQFSNAEIMCLINYVNGSKQMIRQNIPEDSSFSKSIDTDLCHDLLQAALHLQWEAEFPEPDTLWIIGHFENLEKIPDMEQTLIHIDSKLVDCSKLMSKDELLDRLFEDKGTYSTLAEICDENFHKWQTPLYWTYPISDLLHNGCYFVLVKEGVLAISYDVIEEDEHEFFEKESARMCTAENMRYFIDEWCRYSRELLGSMEVLRAYLNRLEEAV